MGSDLIETFDFDGSITEATMEQDMERSFSWPVHVTPKIPADLYRDRRVATRASARRVLAPRNEKSKRSEEKWSRVRRGVKVNQHRF